MSSRVLVMHWRNWPVSKVQTGAAGAAATCAGAAGAAPSERPPNMVLAIMLPATEPAADEAKVPIRPGPWDGAGITCGGGACGIACGAGLAKLLAGRAGGAAEDPPFFLAKPMIILCQKRGRVEAEQLQRT